MAWAASASARALIAAFAATAAVTSVASCRSPREQPSTARDPTATSPSSTSSPTVVAGNAVVEFIIDGDTIDVTVDGREQRVRLIGIDTPETKIPDQPVECWGPEAVVLTEALLPVGTLIRLERDVEPRDAFGRLLAYVIRAGDGLVVNVELARQGAATPLRISPNVAYAERIAAAADEAHAAGRGLWGACPV
jgi:micrococcal nuclease